MEQFKIGDGVFRAGLIRPYHRESGDPVFRPLRIYSTDPADSKLDGNITTVQVPYEPLEPGPVGSLFEIVGFDQTTMMRYPPVDLEDSKILVQGGIKPSPTNYQFLMQMSYAVAMSTYRAFRRALGRDPHWGFGDIKSESAVGSRLKIFPFAFEQENAFYHRDNEAVLFGWFHAEKESHRNLKDGLVFSGLSNDIIVHEVSHALLDGMRPNFLVPFKKETLALHEAFSDLLAVFQHFGHRDLVHNAIQRCQGQIRRASMLTQIARQFGHTTNDSGLSLRTSVDDLECDEDGCRIKDPKIYQPNFEIHELGSVLVSAVFEAFTTIFDRKIQKYIKLATGGSGVLPRGDLPETLTEILAKKASELAEEFLSICIRAIDYCPPVAVDFGDYLRALITADSELVPSDPYGYREALVDAFVRRKIPITGVETLSESSMLWQSEYERVDKELLSIIQRETDEFSELALTPTQKYLQRAKRVGEYLTQSGRLERLGLHSPNFRHPKVSGFDLPQIESARICRRVSPDGQLETDLVVEIIQKVDVKYERKPFPAIQGCTVIVDSRGKLRFVIKKDALQTISQMESQVNRNEFDIRQFWDVSVGIWKEKPNPLAKIHRKVD